MAGILGAGFGLSEITENREEAHRETGDAEEIDEPPKIGR